MLSWQNKQHAHQYEQAHADVSGYLLRARTDGNAPADEERPQAVSEMEGCGNNADDVQSKQNRIVHDAVHRGAQIVMRDFADHDLETRIVHMPDNKTNVITPVIRWMVKRMFRS